MNKMAVGTLQLMSLAAGAEYKLQYQGTVRVAK
jgi:hypothetical protein